MLYLSICALAFVIPAPLLSPPSVRASAPHMGLFDNFKPPEFKAPEFKAPDLGGLSEAFDNDPRLKNAPKSPKAQSSSKRQNMMRQRQQFEGREAKRTAGRKQGDEGKVGGDGFFKDWTWK